MTDPKPIEISDATLAFPASALDFMPAWNDIPEEYKNGSSPWCDFQRTWFAVGLSAKLFKYVAKDGLDPRMIFRQLSAIQGSYAPKHEHKEAAVAYLADLWIDSLIYAPKGQDDPANMIVLGAGTREDWLEVLEREEKILADDYEGGPDEDGN